MLYDFVKEFSCRNRDLKINKVFSVTNSDGFVPSQDYFSKDVFSKDLSNYKIVRKGMLAYNPSRINVGSVACLQSEDEVIVSPLYVVVEVNESGLLAEYLNLFLHSDVALRQIKSLTSGSVRDSLKYDAFTRLRFPIPDIERQKTVINELNVLKDLISKKEQQLRKLEQLAKSFEMGI
ncbi:MAG: restriction endonuclease subunit S [Victivallales bacterium]